MFVGQRNIAAYWDVGRIRRLCGSDLGHKLCPTGGMWYTLLLSNTVLPGSALRTCKTLEACDQFPSFVHFHGESAENAVLASSDLGPARRLLPLLHRGRSTTAFWPRSDPLILTQMTGTESYQWSGTGAHNIHSSLAPVVPESRSASASPDLTPDSGAGHLLLPSDYPKRQLRTSHRAFPKFPLLRLTV